MRGSADMAGMPDVKNRRAFFVGEIVDQDQPLGMKLESTPDFSHSEMHAARGPFFGMRIGRIVSLAFLSSSSVVAFRDPNSDSGNGVCFAASRQAREIIEPEALHSHPAFLNTRRDASSEGERCMKHIVHPIVHFSVHLMLFGRIRSRRSYAWHNDQFGTRTKHRIGLERPHFCARFRAQSNSWGRSSPTARRPRRVFCPRSILQQGATVMNNRDENHTELLTVHEITKLLTMPVSWAYGHSFRRE